jgi:hypothetical protein
MTSEEVNAYLNLFPPNQRAAKIRELNSTKLRKEEKQAYNRQMALFLKKHYATDRRPGVVKIVLEITELLEGKDLK